jgi:hypothetical protein
MEYLFVTWRTYLTFFNSEILGNAERTVHADPLFVPNHGCLLSKEGCASLPLSTEVLIAFSGKGFTPFTVVFNYWNGTRVELR